MNDIGQRIRTKRKSLGMTQDELGEMIGYKKSAVAQIELGNWNPSLKVIESMAAALRTTPQYLLGWEDSENTISIVDSLMRDMDSDYQSRVLDYVRFLHGEMGRKA